VLSATASGAKSGWIIKKHLIPNCISVIIISTALQIPSAIFTESYLSFLGLGVNAPMPSLGSLASDALNGVSSYPYRLFIPAVVISLIVLSLNLFGDGLRDAFDPKING
jgi:oligopeptide transport system permease protein